MRRLSDRDSMTLVSESRSETDDQREAGEVQIRRRTREAQRKRAQAEGRLTPDAGRTRGPGQGRPRGGAAGRAGRVGPGLRPARSRRPARGAVGVAGAGAGADPLRADARVAVHVLPRRGLPDGLGSRRRAEDGAGGAALRRCAPVELRRLRGRRPAADLQHQRLRRDAARPVRVGRQAAGRQLRRRRPRSRLRRQAATRDQPSGGARVPRGDQGLRHDAEPRPLVRPDRR